MKSKLTIIIMCFFIAANIKAQGHWDNVSLNYYVDHVSKPANSNWNVFSLETSFSLGDSVMPKRFIIIPRINMGEWTGNNNSLFQDSKFQGQLDSYWKINKDIFLFFGYGYSPNNVFARNQAFLEGTYSVGKGWSITGGIKYTHWSYTVMTYLAEAEKYIGNIRITVRPMYITSSDKNFFSIRGNCRYYMKDQLSYFNLTGFYGNSPDYSTYLPYLKNILSLKSYGGYVSWQQHIGNRLQSRIGISLRREEYTKSNWRNVIGANLGLTYIF